MPLLRFLPWFRRATRSMPELEARENWSRTELDTYQLDRLNQVWEHARRFVPYHRELAAQHSMPNRWSSLGEFQATFPLMSRPKLQGEEKRLLSDRYAGGHWSRTGGSTGEPLSIYWGQGAHEENMYARYRFLNHWGIEPLDPTVYLWGHAASFLPGWSGWWARLRQPWLDWFRGRLRLSAYKLGQADLKEHLQRMVCYRPTVFYAYSTAAAILAREAQAQGLQFPSLRLAILTAEPAYPHLVRTVERGLGVPAVNEYGSIECGLIAYETPDRTLRVREDRVILETLPREDGRYNLVVTMLGNPEFPLLRYLIGDTTELPLQRPERGFAILHNVCGRVNDLLLTRSGRIVHSTAIDIVMEFNGGDDLRRFVCQQRADGSLHVVIEMAEGQPPVQLAGIQSRLEQLLEGYPVEVEVSNNLPRTAAGKHRWIRSDLYQHQLLETR